IAQMDCGTWSGTNSRFAMTSMASLRKIHLGTCAVSTIVPISNGMEHSPSTRVIEALMTGMPAQVMNQKPSTQSEHGITIKTMLMTLDTRCPSAVSSTRSQTIAGDNLDGIGV